MNPTQPSFRRCTPSTASDGAVKYRGVRKREWGKWVSEIRLPHSRERIWLGSYDSAEKAARAFDAAMYCLRGRDTAAGARFNFPDRIPDHIPRARELSATEIQAVAAEYANNEPQQGTEQGDTRRTVGVDGAAVGGHLGHQEQVHHLASPEGLSPGLSGISHDGTFGDVFDIGWPFPEFHQGSTVDAVDQGFCSSPLMGGDFLPPLESPFHYPCSPEDGSDGSSRGSDIGILPAACQRTSFLWNF